MNGHHNLGRLTHAELAAIDSSIAMSQALGNTGNAGTSDQPCEQATEASADTHHPFALTLSESARKTVAQIKILAGQLAARPSLQQLEQLRGEVVRGPAVSGG